MAFRARHGRRIPRCGSATRFPDVGSVAVLDATAQAARRRPGASGAPVAADRTPYLRGYLWLTVSDGVRRDPHRGMEASEPPCSTTNGCRSHGDGANRLPLPGARRGYSSWSISSNVSCGGRWVYRDHGRRAALPPGGGQLEPLTGNGHPPPRRVAGFLVARLCRWPSRRPTASPSCIRPSRLL